MQTAEVKRVLASTDGIRGESGTIVDVGVCVVVTQVHVPSGVLTDIVVKPDEGDDLIVVNGVESGRTGLNREVVVNSVGVVVTVDVNPVSTTTEGPLVCSFRGCW